jgi:hypothetical protein
MWVDVGTCRSCVLAAPNGGCVAHFLAKSRGTGLATARANMESASGGTDAPGDRIDSISAYCDGWCERCAFTARCSTFAVHVATSMCDDLEEAVELAVGTPRSVEPAPEKPLPEWQRDLFDVELTDRDEAEYERLEKARRERIRQSPVTAIASAIWVLSTDWLHVRRDDVLAQGDAVLADAIDIVSWDVHFIGAKLHRALDGRDRHEHDEDVDDDRIQNDWNGSAKVALISAQRSAAAWRTIAEATGDRGASHLAEELSSLGREVEQLFPDAWTFIRPGFDEPER